ncbi:hypothetical protein HYDPIDRAFT_169896 [Hydnomerulius pinastri MD-312]|uniref:Uncharacterized protein n=1 Tax=Hydnomerulius pinastri MD-312 TaxID=994086 RepID=A0A0C9WBP0_9AGAM|nr:hypothetical protein HYDPIDRAFT_169896 [Hydnomerulius pinastri MD-312]
MPSKSHSNPRKNTSSPSKCGSGLKSTHSKEDGVAARSSSKAENVSSHDAHSPVISRTGSASPLKDSASPRKRTRKVAEVDPAVIVVGSRRRTPSAQPHSRASSNPEVASPVVDDVDNPFLNSDRSSADDVSGPADANSDEYESSLIDDSEAIPVRSDHIRFEVSGSPPVDVDVSIVTGSPHDADSSADDSAGCLRPGTPITHKGYEANLIAPQLVHLSPNANVTLCHLKKIPLTTAYPLTRPVFLARNRHSTSHKQKGKCAAKDHNNVQPLRLIGPAVSKAVKIHIMKLPVLRRPKICVSLLVKYGNLGCCFSYTGWLSAHKKDIHSMDLYFPRVLPNSPSSSSTKELHAMMMTQEFERFLGCLGSIYREHKLHFDLADTSLVFRTYTIPASQNEAASTNRFNPVSDLVPNEFTEKPLNGDLPTRCLTLVAYMVNSYVRKSDSLSNNMSLNIQWAAQLTKPPSKR